ncbi:hypothetical protein [Streptomyces chartreusis]|uniref:hypothetical protein n=1 Tax=Streptomyces chartreusis TaxID=1969 RepID=UPI0033BDF57B
MAAVHAARATIGVLVVVIAALDVVFRGSHRGFMTLLVAVPGLGALRPGRHQRPLFIGALALVTALLLGGLEWRDRPIVVTGTLVNIVLITLVTQRVRSHRIAGDHKRAAEPTDADTRDKSCQLDAVHVEMPAVTAPDQPSLCTVVYDLRPTPFGVRLLAASFLSDGQARTQAAGLIRHWPGPPANTRAWPTWPAA